MTAALSTLTGTPSPEDFIRRNTRLTGTPLLGDEIPLYLACEELPLWRMGEEELAAQGVAAPFWAFAWAGGQALARYLLDHPDVVRGKQVLDFACGCALQGIAAMKSGAAHVTAVDIDPLAAASARLNAEANGVDLTVLTEDLVGTSGHWDVILAGDVCYEGPMATRIHDWLRDMAGSGALVLLGDPGRTYLPRMGLQRLIAYSARTSSELEDTDIRNGVVWRVLPHGEEES